MFGYNYLFLPQSVQFRYGHRIEYTYDALGMKRSVKYKEAKQDMNYSLWDNRVPAESDFEANPQTKQYTGNKVYVDNQLKLILTENGYIEKAGNTYSRYYYLKDHLGNNRIVLDKFGGMVQVTNYYPSGVVMAEEPARGDHWVQPYKFGSKELDRTKGLDFYDFEARQFDPTLLRFTAPDPMAEKYYGISPYAFCGNNPVNRIDPTGMIWEEASLKEVNRLKESLQSRITELNTKMESYQSMINSGTLSDAEVAIYTSEVSAFGDMVSNLNGSIADINRLGNDEKHTYALSSNENVSAGYVSKGTDGKISIVGDGMELTVHEVTHVRQSLDNGKLNFSSKTNKLQYTGSGVEVRANAEVEAYQRQFSVRRTDLNTGLNLRGPNEVTPQVVGKIKRANGTLMYPDINKKYSGK